MTRISELTSGDSDALLEIEFDWRGDQPLVITFNIIYVTHKHYIVILTSNI